MAPALASIFGAGVTIAACLCAGSVLLRRSSLAPPAALVFLSGAALLSIAILLLSLAGGANPWIFLALAIILVVLAARFGAPARNWLANRVASPWWVRLCVLIYAAIYLIHALAPESSADGSSYHLGLVREYLQHGAMVPDPSMYASFPQGMEMLFMLAYALAHLVGGTAGSAGSAAALVHLAFFVALVSLLFDAGRRAGIPAAGYAAGLVMLASPVVGIDAASAYNDVALAAVVLGAFVCAMEGAWSLAGMLAGFAFGIKYTGATMLVWVLAYAAFRSRRLKPLLIVTACAACMMTPWLARNAVWRHDPVAPFLNQMFPNPHQYVSVEQEYRANMASFGGARIDAAWPADVTITGNRIQGAVGLAFLLAPIALFAIRTPWGIAAVSAAAVLAATYPQNLLVRFLIPALPLLALGIALVLARWKWVLGLWAAVQLVSALPWMPLYSGWHIFEIPWQAALRQEPEDAYVRRKLGFPYDIARLIEAHVPPDGVVYTAQPLPDAYAGRKVILNYTSALGNRLYEVLYDAVNRPVPMRFRVNAGSLRCENCGTAGRIYEAPPGTRVASNGWDELLLSDQNRATFWSPWGSGPTAVEVPASGDLLVSPGRWTLNGVDLAPGQAEIRASPKEAMDYFRRAGITHLVIHDQEPAGPAILRDVSAWGLVEEGVAAPCRLYRLATP